MANFGADTPFILLAKIIVKEDKVSEYLELAHKTDKALETAAPGILNFAFDQNPDNPLIFEWSEAYKYDNVFVAHFSNLAVGENLQAHQKVANNFSVEVYGKVCDRCLEVMQRTGVPFKFFSQNTGTSDFNKEYQFDNVKYFKILLKKFFIRFLKS